MAHDRLDGMSVPLTHEFLSLMLGVRRAGVTEALHALETLKLIRSARGEVIVLNRKGIERKVGDAYGAPEAEFRRLIGRAER
jgi:DNA-binding FadR family transcriptional regulator